MPRLILLLMFVLCCFAQSRNDWRLPVQYGTTVPSTCEGGKIFIKTNATAGSNTYACVSGSYVAQGGSGGAALTYGAYASLPATCATGDRYLTSDTVYEFACTTTNTWKTFYKGQLAVIPPSSGWSWNGNQGSSTVSYSLGYGYLYAPANSGDSIRAQVRSISGNYTLTARFRFLAYMGNYTSVGLVLRDSASDKHIVFGVVNNGGMLIYSYYHSTATAAGSGRGTSVVASNFDEIWLRIEDLGTNRVLSYSIDGNTWIQYSIDARTTDLTPNQYGWFGNSNNSKRVDTMLLSWSVQ